VLPQSEKWGIDAVHGLIRAEKELQWPPDPMLRLEAMIPPDGERVAQLAEQLKLSRAEAERLDAWARTEPAKPTTTEGEFAKTLYRGERQGFEDRLRLALSSARQRAQAEEGAMIEAAGYSRLLSFLKDWQRPVFPLKGRDLLQMGARAGPRVGAILRDLESEWIESGFTLESGALRARAAERLKS
jgi:poly(A) polymerase